MSSVPFPSPPVVFRPSIAACLAVPVAAALLYTVFHVGVDHLLYSWHTREEYSYGPMIPFIVGFLVWQRKDRLERLAVAGSWWGAALVAAGAALGSIGQLSWSPLIVNYGLLLALWGLALAYLGGAGFRIVAVPLAMLALMVPLPEFVLLHISQELQLLSSRIGVALIRACDVSVYLEGNVIDLGAMKLQVVEACSGLRYLFALMTLSLIAAYFFKGALWKRAVIFLSSVPITVLMNSLRIAIVGVTVEHFGREAAEGVLHDFEGVVVFLGCVLLLIAQMWLLARIGRQPLPLRTAFGLEFPAAVPVGATVRRRALPASLLAGIAVLAAAALAHAAAPERTTIRPDRREFADFPLALNDWRGRREQMEREHHEWLKPDDYLLANYVGADGKPVNLLSVYYGTQSEGVAPHSPRSCIPGAGWEIARMDVRSLDGVRYPNGEALHVNRAVIRRGGITQLVYYWNHQVGRSLTNEYAIKYDLLWQSIARGRSDGALVRLVTPVFAGETEAQADARLTAFAAAAVPVLLPAYLPDLNAGAP